MVVGLLLLNLLMFAVSHANGELTHSSALLCNYRFWPRSYESYCPNVDFSIFLDGDSASPLETSSPPDSSLSAGTLPYDSTMETFIHKLLVSDRNIVCFLAAFDFVYPICLRNSRCSTALQKAFSRLSWNDLSYSVARPSSLSSPLIPVNIRFADLYSAFSPVQDDLAALNSEGMVAFFTKIFSPSAPVYTTLPPGFWTGSFDGLSSVGLKSGIVALQFLTPLSFYKIVNRLDFNALLETGEPSLLDSISPNIFDPFDTYEKVSHLMVTSYGAVQTFLSSLDEDRMLKVLSAMSVKKNMFLFSHLAKKFSAADDKAGNLSFILDENILKISDKLDSASVTDLLCTDARLAFHNKSAIKEDLFVACIGKMSLLDDFNNMTEGYSNLYVEEGSLDMERISNLVEKGSPELIYVRSLFFNDKGLSLPRFNGLLSSLPDSFVQRSIFIAAFISDEQDILLIGNENFNFLLDFLKYWPEEPLYTCLSKHSFPFDAGSFESRSLSVAKDALQLTRFVSLSVNNSSDHQKIYRMLIDNTPRFSVLPRGYFKGSSQEEPLVTALRLGDMRKFSVPFMYAVVTSQSQAIYNHFLGFPLHAYFDSTLGELLLLDSLELGQAAGQRHSFEYSLYKNSKINSGLFSTRSDIWTCSPNTLSVRLSMITAFRNNIFATMVNNSRLGKDGAQIKNQLLQAASSRSIETSISASSTVSGEHFRQCTRKQALVAGAKCGSARLGSCLAFAVAVSSLLLCTVF